MNNNLKEKLRKYLETNEEVEAINSITGETFQIKEITRPDNRNVIYIVLVPNTWIKQCEDIQKEINAKKINNLISNENNT